jgi:hypothetical protein
MTWDEYESAMRAAKFCFAPYGHGWGMRLSEAVAMGCIPVIVQVCACVSGVGDTFGGAHNRVCACERTCMCACMCVLRACCMVLR